MKVQLKYILGGSALVLAGFAGTALSQSDGSGLGEGAVQPEISKHKTNPHEGFSPVAGSTGQQTPLITYHGGPLMGTPTVYLIWYGNWNQANGSDTPAGQTLVNDFLYGLNNSPYYKTNTSYTTPSGSFVVAGTYTDSYSRGKRLTDSGVQAVVGNAISGRHLPLDANGIYFVLTSTDVSESSGFCTKYCGWHTYGTISGTNIKYSFVGNSNRCLSGCAAQTTSPNGNPGVDGMLSVIAHELEETNTDPNISAWYDSNRAEDADKCAWTFGQNPTLLNGAYYNMTLPGLSISSRNYLIQRELDSHSLCYVNYLTKTQ